jgi:GNAT superfamily N-acetyltransferase
VNAVSPPPEVATIVRPSAALVPAMFACLADYRVHRLGDSPRLDPDFDHGAILAVRNAIARVDLAEKCWIAVAGRDVLGFCCWDWLDAARGQAKTVLLAVRRDSRRLGVGSLLQQRRIEEMLSAGAREVHTWSDDAQAVEWYLRRGYDRLGEEPLCHCLHLFTLGREAWWAVHRGHETSRHLTHLYCRLPANESRRSRTLPPGRSG